MTLYYSFSCCNLHMRYFARGEDILSYVYIATWNSKNLSTIPSLISFRPPQVVTCSSASELTGHSYITKMQSIVHLEPGPDLSSLPLSEGARIPLFGPKSPSVKQFLLWKWRMFKHIIFCSQSSPEIMFELNY